MKILIDSTITAGQGQAAMLAIAVVDSSGRACFLWMIWKNDRPGDAGMAGKGALVSAIINVVLFILWIVFAGILFAASGFY